MQGTRAARIARATTEELVDGILAVLDRTYTTAGPTGPTPELAEFFRALDEGTLRAVAYQHGVFDRRAAEGEPERENRDAS